MDSQSKSSTSLPSIAALDFGSVKKEDNEMMRKPAPISTTNPPLSSYSQPTPPYSQPPSMSSSYASPRADLASPPESRRMSKEETGIIRRSLPSISEALGSSRFSVSSNSTIVSPGSTSTNPPRSCLEPTTDASRHVGPSTDRRYEAEAPTRPAYSSSVVPVSQSYVSAYDNKLPTLLPQTSARSPSTQHSSSSYASQSSSHEPKSLLAASTLQSLSAPYQQPVPASTSTYRAPATYGSQWRSEPITDSQLNKSGRSAHEDAIKHHIQSLDLTNAGLDVSLREVEDQGIQLVDFSRYYIAQRKQNQHLGPLMNAVPSLLDVETLIVRSHRLQENLVHLKGLVEAHHIAVRENAQQKASLKRPFEPESHGDSANYQFQEDGQDGSPGSSAPRKRRGRAAPPGRCHSCNRNETPEWRRGPDGARTLCNACGLHYAKLTRKMNSNGTKQSAAGSSNPAAQAANGATPSGQALREE